MALETIKEFTLAKILDFAQGLHLTYSKMLWICSYSLKIKNKKLWGG